jgi:hypothetical protein
MGRIAFCLLRGLLLEQQVVLPFQLLVAELVENRRHVGPDLLTELVETRQPGGFSVRQRPAERCLLR